MFRFIFFTGFILFTAVFSAHAEVAIEASVSSYRVALGNEIVLDVTVSDADGPVSKPNMSSMDGFTAYSQGHSQEYTFVNGQSSTRSTYTYVLIANSLGKKKLGPFEIKVGNRIYEVPAVEIEVLQSTTNSSRSSTPVSQSYTQGPVSAPSPRALPTGQVSDQDIFVRVWLDKDEVFVNEPATLTYTIFTRLPSTYKGFDKEPVLTGFWVEDFPPEKVIQKKEQLFNGRRYVAADVRRMALFPTEPGVFTIDPGKLSTVVEIQSQDNFDSFFSYNVFGYRSRTPSAFATQAVPKFLETEKLALTVKSLPEQGKPGGFSGAVGHYTIEASLDKKEVEEGVPVTYRVKISGGGNVSTVEPPAVPPMDYFKVYDALSSVNISKERGVVEGEKVTETVLLPKKAGSYTIPGLPFSYFDPLAKEYRTLQTPAQSLTVKPSTEIVADDSSADPEQALLKKQAPAVSKDIRYIKTLDGPRPLWKKPLHEQPVYWALNVLMVVAAFVWTVLARNKAEAMKDVTAYRQRLSFRMARRRLRVSHRMLGAGKTEAFYRELEKAIHGYFSDKLNISNAEMSYERIEAGLRETEIAGSLLAEFKSFLDQLSLGRFANVEQTEQSRRELYDTAFRIISQFEKVKMP